MKQIIVMLVMAGFVGGCGGEVAAFLEGTATGMVVAMDAGNEELVRYKENVVKMKSESVKIADELDKIKDDPVGIVSLINPNLGEAVNTLAEKLPTLISNAEKLKEEAEGLDWKMALATLLLGGTGVNLFKNKFGKK